MAGFIRILGLVLFLGGAVSSWAQTTADDTPPTLVEQLQSLDAQIEQYRARDAQLAKIAGADQSAIAYRRAERGLGVLRELSRLMGSVAGLPEDDPQRPEMVALIDSELIHLVDLVLAQTEELNQHIAEIQAEVDSSSGSDRIAREAYLYSLRQLRVQYFQGLGDAVEAKRSLGLSVEDALAQLGGQLYLLAEALAGRLEYSGAALAGLQARLVVTPDNAELIDAEKLYAGVHTLHLERLAAVSKLLGRLGLDNDQYQSLLIRHGQSVSVRDLNQALLKQRLVEIWEQTQVEVIDEAPDLMFRALVFVLILLFAFYLSRLTRRAVVAACERSGEKMSRLLKNMLASISGGIVLGIGLLMALSQIGISLAPMLAGLGVAGFIVGFALQDTLGNFAAGGMILIYRPYDVGDLVEVAGAFGEVKKMSLVSTTITTLDNQTLVVPNSKIWGDVIKNVTAQRVRRVDLEFGVGYGDDIEKVEGILQDIIDNHEAVLSSPKPTIKLHTLGDSSVNFIVRPWVKTADYWEVYWDVTREAKMRFDREGVTIPFPQRDVHLYQDSG